MSDRLVRSGTTREVLNAYETSVARGKAAFRRAVPRWGTESAIAQALAPAASACRVGLVFEAGGKTLRGGAGAGP